MRSLFTQAYIEALLWAESGDDDSPLGKEAIPEDLSAEALAVIDSDCAAFLDDAEIAALVNKLGPEQCGHDFWLTRRGHGVGFWDRGYSGAEESALMHQCNKFHDPDLYRGDDGKIYFMS